jgi:hypothetical protein
MFRSKELIELQTELQKEHMVDIIGIGKGELVYRCLGKQIPPNTESGNVIHVVLIMIPLVHVDLNK